MLANNVFEDDGGATDDEESSPDEDEEEAKQKKRRKRIDPPSGQNGRNKTRSNTRATKRTMEEVELRQPILRRTTLNQTLKQMNPKIATSVQTLRT
ncbi:hypothetical protein NQ318_001902 [Aromia moschata]|uniref:Uncharacterized protein n=1 Tax=Aromia moschata TaxID=1265417 RepID=A0AAV8Z193_9CUCU|nr:hypothetical protein NQ318_001902 [Aromia moschata]